MKSYQFIKSVFLFFIIMSCLVACRSVDSIDRKDKITEGILSNDKGELTVIEGVREDKISDGILFNDKGELIVIDGKSSRRVPKCKDWELAEKEEISGKDIKYPSFKCNKDVFNQKEVSEISRFYKNQKGYDTSTEKITDIIIIKDFKGSVCRTYYSSATGIEIQICRPPF